MISRQPKIHFGLRIVAAGSIVLWLLAVLHCSIEHLFGNDHHHAEAGASETFAHHNSGHSHEAEAAEHTHSKARHSQDSEQQSSHNANHHDDGDDSCCSTLMATAQFALPFFIAKPVLQPLNFPCTVLQARDRVFAALEDKPERQVKDRDWVFTPEVCLGPAFRSLAPPSLT